MRPEAPFSVVRAIALMRGRRRLAVVLAALLATLLCGAAPAAACDIRKVVRAHEDASRTVRAPLILGDSTMLLATAHLAARGIEADARGCRQLRKGVDLLAVRGRAGTLPPVVVLALGSNGVIRGAQINRALRVLGPSRVLGLVTPARVGSGSAGPMRRAARRHPDRVVLIDWMRYSRGRGDVFAGDGLHVSDRGARVFARYVRRRLDPFFPPRALHVPDRPAHAKRCGSARGLEVLVVRGGSRVSCTRARTLGRTRALAGIRGWRYYDWRRSGRRPWSAVYLRVDRRVIVVTRPTSRRRGP